jgi:hypothetical protein
MIPFLPKNRSYRYDFSYGLPVGARGFVPAGFVLQRHVDERVEPGPLLCQPGHERRCLLPRSIRYSFHSISVICFPGCIRCVFPMTHPLYIFHDIYPLYISHNASVVFPSQFIGCIFPMINVRYIFSTMNTLYIYHDISAVCSLLQLACGAHAKQ